MWPCWVRFCHGGVQLVVELPQDAHQALFVDAALFFGEGLPGALFFQDVVHIRHGQMGVQLLLPLTVGVEALAEGADVGFLGVGGGWEGEGFEAAGF